ncbi:MAG: hypothetical protein FJ224_06900 [Lentisphaerae bacterium]|nr:hypothetical protein [Lentisphaerota bacterium]
MNTGNEDYGRLSPDVLLQGFLRKKLVLWILVAAGIHLVVILLTSAGYIRDRIDPDGAAARVAAAEAAKKGASAEAAKKGASAGAGTNEAATATGVVATGEVAVATGAAKAIEIDGEVVPDSATDSAIVKKITEVAKPEELPDASDLGIDLEDTRTR